jgi:DNA polymerase III alpha subunit
VVVAEKNLIGLIPLKKQQDFLISCLEEKSLTLLGLKKFDFLSLKETLGSIRETAQLVASPLPKYSAVDLADEKT